MEEQKQSLLKARWCPLILLLLFLALLKAEKRCSFITSNSDPIYVAWGGFIHDGFDAETISKFTEKKISSISTDYGIELNPIRGVFGYANRILEIKKGFGSFDNYLWWGFVNHKPIATQHKSCHKILVKTSKSKAMSKDMVRRGFRFVNPTIIHSFMVATRLTNDHLLTCPRHLQCHLLASPLPAVTPALLK